jgi:hypothetical protein
VSGPLTGLHKCRELRRVDLTDTGAEGSAGALVAQCPKLRKAKLGGTKCTMGAAPPPALLKGTAQVPKRTVGSF